MAKMFRKFTSSIVLGAALLAVVGLAPMAEGDKAKNNGLAANERSLAKPAMLPEYYYNPIASKFHYIKRFCEDVCFLNTDLRNTFDLNNGKLHVQRACMDLLLFSDYDHIGYDLQDRKVFETSLC